MKFVPILLSALFLATTWLSASASTTRHQRQLRVPLPLPTSSPHADRRKSGLFPRMGASFVVTDRAHKMAAPNKMAPMKRTNALLPNLSLKQRIMGGTTKRMTGPGPITGLPARPVVIRPFNLTKPTLRIVSTTRTPLVITRRPLLRNPTLVDAGSKVTVETPSLTIRKPIMRPLIQTDADNKITSASPLVTRRPINRLPNRADNVTRLTEEAPVIATKRPSIRPHFHAGFINKLSTTRSPIVRTTNHVETDKVAKETASVVSNQVESDSKTTVETQDKTTKRPSIRPHFHADTADNKLTVTRSPIVRTTNHPKTDKVTEETSFVTSNHVDSDSEITEETPVKTTKRPTIKPNFHVNDDNKLTVTKRPIVVKSDHIDTDIKFTEETSFLTTELPSRFTTQSDIKTTTKSAIEETTFKNHKRPTLRPHTQLTDSKDIKISAGEKVSLPSPTKRPLLKSPAQIIYNKDDSRMITTEAPQLSTSRQSVEGDGSKGATKSVIEETPVVDNISSLIRTRSEVAEDISEGTPLVRVKRLQANGASFNVILDSRIKKGVSRSEVGMPGGLSHRDWWWW